MRSIQYLLAGAVVLSVAPSCNAGVPMQTEGNPRPNDSAVTRDAGEDPRCVAAPYDLASVTAFFTVQSCSSPGPGYSRYLAFTAPKQTVMSFTGRATGYSLELTIETPDHHVVATAKAQPKGTSDEGTTYLYVAIPPTPLVLGIHASLKSTTGSYSVTTGNVDLTQTVCGPTGGASASSAGWTWMIPGTHLEGLMLYSCPFLADSDAFFTVMAQENQAVSATATLSTPQPLGSRVVGLGLDFLASEKAAPLGRHDGTGGTAGVEYTSPVTSMYLLRVAGVVSVQPRTPLDRAVFSLSFTSP